MRLECCTRLRASTYSPSGRVRSPWMVSSSKLMTVFFSYSTRSLDSALGCCAGAASGRPRARSRSVVRIAMAPSFSIDSSTWPEFRGKPPPAPPSRPRLAGLAGRLRLLLLRGLHPPGLLLGRPSRSQHLLALALQLPYLAVGQGRGPGGHRVALELGERRDALLPHPRQEDSPGQVDLGQLPAGEPLGGVVGGRGLVGLAQVAQGDAEGALGAGVGGVRLEQGAGLLGHAGPVLLAELEPEELHPGRRVAGLELQRPAPLRRRCGLVPLGEEDPADGGRQLGVGGVELLGPE